VAPGFGQWGDQEATPGFSGFTSETGGGTMGYDYTFGKRLTVGVSGGYARTSVTFGGGEGSGTIQSALGSVYASYFTERAHIDGAVTYGRNAYHNDRKLVIGTIQRTAKSEHDGDVLSTYLGAGYAFPFGRWALEPVGSLRYTYLSEEGFQETGADSLNLQMGRRTTHSLVSELGLRVSAALPTEYGTWFPEARAAWSYDFDVDDRAITTSYAGAPGTTFSIPGQPVARHGAILGAGLTFVHRSGLSTALRYTGELRNDYQAHGVLGEVRVEF
jgi:outer membrane autotransporter protein